MTTNHKPSDSIHAQGETLTLRQWAERLGCPVQTILGRMDRGWSTEDALFKPLSSTGGQSRGKRYDADVLVGDEIQRVMTAANNGETSIRDRAFIVVGYRSGLRCSELLALKTKDVDLVNGVIRVQHGKGDKARTVAIDLEAVEQLRQWLGVRSTWETTIDSPIFCTRKGTMINGRQMRAMMSRRGKKAGIDKRVHAHGLRRTMASEMAAEGVNLTDIQGALGHSNAATTNTYLHKLNPTSVLDAMRSRRWGNNVTNLVTSPSTTLQASTTPPPDWLDRLKSEIGNRLRVFHDMRTTADEFEAIILLIPRAA